MKTASSVEEFEVEGAGGLAVDFGGLACHCSVNEVSGGGELS